MTSIIKVNTIQDADGNNIINESSNTITIGASGDTTNIIGTLQNNGAAVGGANTPAFLVKFSANVTDQAGDSAVKAPYNTEIYDTDNAYDNSSNYRFTVPSGKGGKYHIFMHQHIRDQGQNDNYSRLSARIYKNGSFYTEYQRAFPNGNNYYAGDLSNYVNIAIDMSLSAGDYIEFYIVVYNTNFKFMEEGSYAGGYKLIE